MLELYSIGHGRRPIQAFIAALKSHDIQFLLDIRSKPFSRWNPQFNRPSLQSELSAAGITYVFVGDSLGGRPEDKSCYDADGRVLYDLVKEKDFFKRGLDRLTTAKEKGIRLVLMCSESKPEACHRSKLIGQELLKRQISLKHITPDQQIKSQEQLISEINKGRATVDLFGNSPHFRSRKSYCV